MSTIAWKPERDGLIFFSSTTALWLGRIVYEAYSRDVRHGGNTLMRELRLEFGTQDNMWASAYLMSSIVYAMFGSNIYLLFVRLLFLASWAINLFYHWGVLFDPLGRSSTLVWKTMSRFGVGITLSLGISAVVFLVLDRELGIPVHEWAAQMTVVSSLAFPFAIGVPISCYMLLFTRLHRTVVRGLGVAVATLSPEERVLAARALRTQIVRSDTPANRAIRDAVSLRVQATLLRRLSILSGLVSVCTIWQILVSAVLAFCIEIDAKNSASHDTFGMCGPVFDAAHHNESHLWIWSPEVIPFVYWVLFLRVPYILDETLKDHDPLSNLTDKGVDHEAGAEGEIVVTDHFADNEPAGAWDADSGAEADDDKLEPLMGHDRRFPVKRSQVPAEAQGLEIQISLDELYLTERDTRIPFGVLFTGRDTFVVVSRKISRRKRRRRASDADGKGASGILPGSGPEMSEPVDYEDNADMNSGYIRHSVLTPFDMPVRPSDLLNAQEPSDTSRQSRSSLYNAARATFSGFLQGSDPQHRSQARSFHHQMHPLDDAFAAHESDEEDDDADDLADSDEEDDDDGFADDDVDDDNRLIQAENPVLLKQAGLEMQDIETGGRARGSTHLATRPEPGPEADILSYGVTARAATKLGARRRVEVYDDENDNDDDGNDDAFAQGLSMPAAPERDPEDDARLEQELRSRMSRMSLGGPARRLDAPARRGTVVPQGNAQMNLYDNADDDDAELFGLRDTITRRVDPPQKAAGGTIEEGCYRGGGDGGGGGGGGGSKSAHQYKSQQRLLQAQKPSDSSPGDQMAPPRLSETAKAKRKSASARSLRQQKSTMSPNDARARRKSRRRSMLVGWEEIGRTEVVRNQANPSFILTTLLPADWSPRTRVRFDIFNVHSSREAQLLRTDEENLLDHNWVGTCYVPLGDLREAAHIADGRGGAAPQFVRKIIVNMFDKHTRRERGLLRLSLRPYVPTTKVMRTFTRRQYGTSSAPLVTNVFGTKSWHLERGYALHPQYFISETSWTGRASAMSSLSAIRLTAASEVSAMVKTVTDPDGVRRTGASEARDSNANGLRPSGVSVVGEGSTATDGPGGSRGPPVSGGGQAPWMVGLACVRRSKGLIFVREELIESPFCHLVPRAYMRLARSRRATEFAALMSRFHNVTDVETLMWGEMLLARLELALEQADELGSRDVTETNTFKASVDKKDLTVPHIPTNLHTHVVLLGLPNSSASGDDPSPRPSKGSDEDERSPGDKDVCVFDIASVGAFSAHTLGYKHGGLHKMLAYLHKVAYVEEATRRFDAAVGSTLPAAGQHHHHHPHGSTRPDADHGHFQGRYSTSEMPDESRARTSFPPQQSVERDSSVSDIGAGQIAGIGRLRSRSEAAHPPGVAGGRRIGGGNGNDEEEDDDLDGFSDDSDPFAAQGPLRPSEVERRNKRSYAYYKHGGEKKSTDTDVAGGGGGGGGGVSSSSGQESDKNRSGRMSLTAQLFSRASLQQQQQQNKQRPDHGDEEDQTEAKAPSPGVGGSLGRKSFFDDVEEDMDDDDFDDENPTELREPTGTPDVEALQELSEEEHERAVHLKQRQLTEEMSDMATFVVPWDLKFFRTAPLDEKMLTLAVLLRQRMDMCFSQALTTLITVFAARLELAEPFILSRMAQTGFLIQHESLLSTHGKEMGMISDHWQSIKALRLVTLCVQHCPGALPCAGSNNHVVAENEISAGGVKGFDLAWLTPEDIAGRISPEVEAGRRLGAAPARLVVTLFVDTKLYSRLPNDLCFDEHISREHPRLIPVFPLLFSVGVNEMQTYANRVGNQWLQEIINRQNFDELGWYIHHCYKPVLERHREALVHQAVAAERAHAREREALEEELLMREEEIALVEKTLHQLQNLISESIGSSAKHWKILATASDLVRLAHGGRVTSCKSAKDRTGMSVTLEETRVLQQVLANDMNTTAAEGFRFLLHLLRLHGVRVDNVEKNVGMPRFAFNNFQVRMLPPIYRPPAAVAGSAQS